MEDDVTPEYEQMWLPGFKPRTEQPDLPGFAAYDEIEPSVSDLEDTRCGCRS